MASPCAWYAHLLHRHATSSRLFAFERRGVPCAGGERRHRGGCSAAGHHPLSPHHARVLARQASLTSQGTQALAGTPLKAAPAMHTCRSSRPHPPCAALHPASIPRLRGIDGAHPTHGAWHPANMPHVQVIQASPTVRGSAPGRAAPAGEQRCRAGQRAHACTGRWGHGAAPPLPWRRAPAPVPRAAAAPAIARSPKRICSLREHARLSACVCIPMGVCVCARDRVRVLMRMHLPPGLNANTLPRPPPTGLPRLDSR